MNLLEDLSVNKELYSRTNMEENTIAVSTNHLENGIFLFKK